MYENDYSWVPALLAGEMAMAAVGGLIVSLIRANRIRARALWAWLTVPILLAIGLGVFAAIYGGNLEPYSPILFVPMLSAILLPPWLVAAGSVFSFSRYLQGVIVERTG